MIHSHMSTWSDANATESMLIFDLNTGCGSWWRKCSSQWPVAKKCYLLIKVGRCKSVNALLFVTKCIHINETTAGISVFFYRNLLNVFECSSLTLWKCTVAYAHIYNSNVCALMMVRIFSTDFFCCCCNFFFAFRIGYYRKDRRKIIIQSMRKIISFYRKRNIYKMNRPEEKSWIAINTCWKLFCEIKVIILAQTMLLLLLLLLCSAMN